MSGNKNSSIGDHFWMAFTVLKIVSARKRPIHSHCYGKSPGTLCGREVIGEGFVRPYTHELP